MQVVLKELERSGRAAFARARCPDERGSAAAHGFLNGLDNHEHRRVHLANVPRHSYATHMKAANLHDAWASPDNTRLTPKQFSFRLPIHVAAKVAALCEMFPHKSRTQIIADLLSSALDELDKSLPEAPGEPVEEQYNDEIAEQIDRRGEKLFCLGGVRGRFQGLANQHYRDLERELGNETPDQLFQSCVGSKADFGAK